MRCRSAGTPWPVRNDVDVDLLVPVPAMDFPVPAMTFVDADERRCLPAGRRNGSSGVIATVFNFDPEALARVRISA